MALIQFNHLSFCKRSQTNVTLILPTSGMDDLHDGEMFETKGMMYQTLWLLHGGGGDNSDFLNFSNIVRYANEHKIAVVMPAGTRFYDTDYEYVTEELPHVLRAIFPLSDKKEDNFIGGLSHGGDCAMKACFEHPDRYAAGLIMSAAGTTHKGDIDQAQLLFDVYGCAEKMLKDPDNIPMMIFATGSGDRGMPYYERVINRLDEMGLPVNRYYIDGDGHSWDFWDSTVRKALDEMLPIRDELIMPGKENR